MSSGTVFTPGGAGLAWVEDVWDKEIDVEAYERSVIRRFISDRPRGLGQMHIRKHGNLTPSTLATTADLGEPAFSANTETEFTMTPNWVDLNVSVSDMVLARMAQDPSDTFKASIESAIAQKMDQDIATLFAAFITNISGNYASSLDKAKILDAKSKVHAGAKEFGDDDLHFFYHHLQDDAVLTVDSFVNAQVRGSGEKGAVSGRVGSGFGLQFHRTGNVRNSGGGFNNGIIPKRAIVIAFNQRLKVEAQRHGKANWILGGADYAVGTVRDAYCGLLKSEAA